MFPAAFSSDEQTLYVFHIPQSATPFYYNVKNDIWKELWDARFEDTSYDGFQAVTDPRSGLIYIAGGYDSINYNVTSMKKLDIFDPVDLSIIAENLPNPDETFPVRWHYGSVWSKTTTAPKWQYMEASAGTGQSLVRCGHSTWLRSRGLKANREPPAPLLHARSQETSF
ncbi:hypothetical protein BGZ97_006801 [Linnemannia gamsii]|uniref:Kelch repeat protein n=1 Tax=Linnemannia gamsii TaxID=64522 RepID=A0A9P6URU2_9FUNG|nr:hypothetical protein BGZ97_006801 [Linnemannia gamsii]